MITWLVFLLLSLIWSSTWLAIKIGLATLPPFLSAGIRFLIAFCALALYARFKKIPFPRDWASHRFFLLFSLINFTVGYALVYWGEQFIPSGLTSVLFTVMPFYVLFLAPWMLPDEPFSYKKLLGVVIGFVGVLIIFYDQLRVGSGAALWGMTAVLISPAFSAAGTIMGKNARARWDTVTLNTYPLLYTALSLLLLHVLLEQGTEARFTAQALFSLFYLGVFGTALAFALYFWMLKKISALLMSLITYVTPPLALIWGWLVLNERVSQELIIGMVIIFSGIALVRYSR